MIKIIIFGQSKTVYLCAFYHFLGVVKLVSKYKKYCLLCDFFIVTLLIKSYKEFLKMPSQKPRIALTVEPELDAVLQRLSILTGEPKTRIITDF